MRFIKIYTLIFTCLLLASCKKSVSKTCDGGGEIGAVCKELFYRNNKVVTIIDYAYDENFFLHAKYFQTINGDHLASEEFTYDAQGNLQGKQYLDENNLVFKEEKWIYEGGLLTTFQTKNNGQTTTFQYDYNADDLLETEKQYSFLGELELVKNYEYFEGDTAVQNIRIYKNDELYQLITCTWFSGGTYKQVASNMAGNLIGQKISVFNSDGQLIQYKTYDSELQVNYAEMYEYKNNFLSRYTKQNFPGEIQEVEVLVND